MKNKSRSIILILLIFAFWTCVIISGCSLFDGIFGENGEPKKTLKTPEVYRVGSIFSWNSVDRATNYIVSFGGKETSVSGTACRVTDIENGGTLSVTAVNKTADGKISEQSETVDIELSAINELSPKYKRYELSSANITIPAQVEKAVIAGDGQYYDANIYIDTRTTPLIVEVYDVHCKYFGIKNNDNTTVNECVTVRSLGNEGSSFHGTSGSRGEAGKTGGGLLGAGGKGGRGTDGGDGGRFNYVVFEGDKPITFQGGRGGDGGNGGVANQWNTSGGTGGEGGYGKFMGMDGGDKGSNGSNGSAFAGLKEEVTYQIVEAGKADSEDNNGNDDNKDDGTASTGNVTGTYRFYSATSEDGQIVYAGEELNGQIMASNSCVLIFKDNSTCEITFTVGDDSKSGVLSWERYENTMFLTDENDNITRATVDGEFISIAISGMTLTLKEEK